MRDILTATAGVLILILLAALVAPWVVDWRDYRRQIDARLSLIAGVPVRTEGDIGLRLLPAPRLSFATLLIGADGAMAPTARIDGLNVEIGLLPLMQRQVHVTSLRMERLDATLATDAAGAVVVPPDFGSGAAPRWAIAVDQLALGQGTLRLVEPDGSRTVVAPVVVVADAQDLSGPWRIQGAVGDFPLKATLGAPEADGRLRLKLTGGGDVFPKVDFDGLVGRTADGKVIDGTAKLSLGPPGQALDSGLPVPVTLTGAVAGTPRDLTIGNATLDVADGPAALHFTGKGQLSGKSPRLALAFDAKTIDADAFLLSPAGKAALAASGRGFGRWPIPTDLQVAVGRLTLGNEETGSLDIAARIDTDGASLQRFAAILPGQSRVSFQTDGAVRAGLAGRLTLDVANPEPLAGFLTTLQGPATFVRLSGDRPFKVATDILLTDGVFAARGFRWQAGDATLGGTIRYAAPENEAGRGRLDAQISANAFDLTRLPSLDGLRRSLAPIDFALTLDARDVRYGTDLRSGSGVQARLLADGSGLTIDTLDITNVAGANASAQGKIGADGNGRIDGRVSTDRIGPIALLAGKLWGGEPIVAGTPRGVLDAKLSGTFAVEASAAQAADGMTARFEGTSGAVAVRLNAAFGRDEQRRLEGVKSGSLSLDAPNGRDILRLVNADAPSLAASPAQAKLDLVRDERDGFIVTLRATSPDWSVETSQPVPLQARPDGRREGTFHVTAPDATPWLRDWNLVPSADVARRPADVTTTIGPVEGRWVLVPQARIGEIAAGGRLTVNPASRAVSGNLTFNTVSLATFAGWAGLKPAAPSAPGSLWSSARFMPRDALPFTTEIRIDAARVDLGDGRIGQNGIVTLLLSQDSAALRPAEVDYGGTHLNGEITVTRNGGQASIAGEVGVRDLDALAGAAGPSPIGGALGARVRFGGTGESPAAILANLSGAGQANWRNLLVPKLAPGAVGTVAATRAKEEGAMPTPDDLRRDLGRALDAGPFAPVDGAARDVPVVLTGGVVRFGPILVEMPEARLNGQIALDLKTASIDARASLQATQMPPGWIGGAPQIGVSWKGTLGTPPVRDIDVGPLANGIAALRLSKEVEKIEIFEQDARERAFFNRRLRAERERYAPPSVPAPAPGPTPAPVPAPAPSPEPATPAPPRPLQILPGTPSNP